MFDINVCMFKLLNDVTMPFWNSGYSWLTTVLLSPFQLDATGPRHSRLIVNSVHFFMHRQVQRALALKTGHHYLADLK